jgi:uncharacterized protein involved in response to NO
MEAVSAARGTFAGVPLFAKGFRPFFLLAALWAGVALPLWLIAYRGLLSVGTYVAPTYWHAHEMVFGYAIAVVAGFLLTAAGNWTQRETLVGAPLFALSVLWVLGRVTMFASAALPPAVVAGSNLLFLPVLSVVLARVIYGARSRRNYGIPIVVAALFAAQLLVHLDALGLFPGGQRLGVWLGVDLLVLLILVIGGRIIPLFTRNATGAATQNRVWLDRGALAAMALLVAADAVNANGLVVAMLAGVTGLLAAARAVSWGAGSTLRKPILWVLHVGYAFVPVGLLLRALGAAMPVVSPSLALHALTVGAIGVLTFGMMVRVALGHTGRPIQASSTMTAAMVLMVSSALVRVVGPLVAPAHTWQSLHSAGTLWSLAFLLFLVQLGRALVAPRADGKPG